MGEKSVRQQNGIILGIRYYSATLRGRLNRRLKRRGRFILFPILLVILLFLLCAAHDQLSGRRRGKWIRRTDTRFVAGFEAERMTARGVWIGCGMRVIREILAM
jgi:hypothetical protein